MAHPAVGPRSGPNMTWTWPLLVFLVTAIAIVTLSAQNWQSVRSGRGVDRSAGRRQVRVMGLAYVAMALVAGASVVGSGQGLLAAVAILPLALGLLFIRGSRPATTPGPPRRS